MASEDRAAPADSRGRSVEPRALLRLAVGCALFFGTLEGLETAAIRNIPRMHALTKVSLDILWIAPVFHLLLNLLIAGGLWLVARLGVRLTLPLTAGIFVFVGALGVAACTGVLAHAASVLLALGVAVQATRLWPRYGASRWLRATAWSLAIFVVAAPIGLQAVERWRASGMEPRLPAPVAGSPNVLLIVLDTVGAGHMSLYGYSRPTTPRLERFAAEAVTFDNAYASSSWTLPSHASLLTGLPVSKHGALSGLVRLEPAHAQIQQVFQGDGYATGAFIANNVFVLPERGFAAGFQQFDVYDFRTLFARTTYGRVLKQVLRRVDIALDPYWSAGDLNTRFHRWVSGLGGRPFFALINYMDAHEPYLVGGQRPDLRVWDRGEDRTPAENQALADAYDRAITHLDADIGRFFDELARESWWNNTLVVIVSDHGEAVSDGSFDHGTDLVREQLHVPLVVRLPGSVPVGVRVAAPVSLTDVPATVQKLAGLSGGQQMPGTSLDEWWRAPDGQPGDARVFAQVTLQNGIGGMMRSLVDRDHQYIVNQETGKERLYDLRRDPAQVHDLASDPGSSDVMRRMRDSLAREAQ